MRLDMTTEGHQEKEKEETDTNEMKTSLKSVDWLVLDKHISRCTERQRIENQQLIGEILKEITPAKRLTTLHQMVFKTRETIVVSAGLASLGKL